MVSDQQHALYRFYDEAGALLYIGITHNPGARFPQHEKDKPWWSEVRGISIESCSSRAAAMAAETRAIAIESPRYNVQRPSLPSRKTGRRGQTVTPSLVWVCDSCRTPVGNTKGYIHLDTIDLAPVESAWNAYERNKRDDFEVDLGAILALPDPAPWRVHHQSCDPNLDGDSYWFDVSRARTHAHLLNWTAHLMEKVWLRHTNWPQFINYAAEVDA